MVVDAVATSGSVSASDYVVTVTSVKGGTVLDAEKASTSDYVAAISSIDSATVVEPYASIGGSTRNSVVIIASSYGAKRGHHNSSSHFGNASDYVVTISSINDATVTFSTTQGVGSKVATRGAKANTTSGSVVSVTAAGEYIIPIAGIENTIIEKAEPATITSNSVVASKSISDTSIDYLLYPRRGNNIILLSKR
jgi:hypothetical protein